MYGWDFQSNESFFWFLNGRARYFCRKNWGSEKLYCYMVHNLDYWDWIFKKVTLFFYVCGYKNNDTDCIFNILTGGYHNKDIYTFQYMVQVLNHHGKVKVINMKPYQFIDYNQFSKTFHKIPQYGNINIKICFCW